MFLRRRRDEDDDEKKEKTTARGKNWDKIDYLLELQKNWGLNRSPQSKEEEIIEKTNTSYGTVHTNSIVIFVNIFFCVLNKMST